MSVEIKMLKYGVWNISGKHKTMEEGEVYKVPARCAKEICDSGQGEYTGKDKPAPEENKAMKPEENKAAEAKEEKAEPETVEEKTEPIDPAEKSAEEKAPAPKKTKKKSSGKKGKK